MAALQASMTAATTEYSRELDRPAEANQLSARLVNVCPFLVLYLSWSLPSLCHHRCLPPCRLLAWKKQSPIHLALDGMQVHQWKSHWKVHVTTRQLPGQPLSAKPRARHYHLKRHCHSAHLKQRAPRKSHGQLIQPSRKSSGLPRNQSRSHGRGLKGLSGSSIRTITTATRSKMRPPAKACQVFKRQA